MYTNTSVLCENLSKKEQSKKLKLYQKIGYQSLFINFDYDRKIDFSKALQDIQSSTTMEIYGKITLYPKEIKQLKNELRLLPVIDDFITVIQSTNKDILTFAANDSRVYGLSCPKIMNLKFITPGVISLVKINQKFIEISLRDALLSKTQERSRMFHELSKFLKNMHSCLNSLTYGGWEQNILETLGPHEIIAIFSALFDIPVKICKSFVQSNPQKLIEKLKNKINSHYIEKGVKKLPSNL